MSEMNRDPQDRQREAEVLPHDYDGIQEFDNPLPNWWLLTFYVSIAYSVLYIGYYHFGPGPSPEQEMHADVARIETLAEASRKAAPAPSDDELNAVLADPARRAQGKQIYTEKCAACHGADGQGMIGPNLTDKFWIHGNGSLAALLQVITDGVADKGMPPWGPLLTKDQLFAATAHVKGLQGTKPANPKEPQGTEVTQ